MFEFFGFGKKKDEGVVTSQEDNVEASQESAESLKVEWGEETESMVCFDATKRIQELNKDLAEGEKPWRLPTSAELKVKFGSSIGYWSVQSYPDAYTGAMIKDSMKEKLVPVRDIA